MIFENQDDTTSSMERKSGVFFFTFCAKLDEKSSPQIIVSLFPFLSTHIGQCFRYLQLVSKTLVPSSPSGAKTFLRGTKPTSRTNAAAFTAGPETHRNS